MQAIIQKLELKKILNRHYIKMELIDENGVKRSLDNPFLSDDINFRKQVFGILSACDCFDLMMLATDNPKPKKIVGYYQNSLQILENENKEWLSLNKKTVLYECKKPDKNTRAIFDTLVERKIFNGYKEEGIIESIVSRSGTFQLLFTGKSCSTFFITNQIYCGFGYPLTIGTNANPNVTALSAKGFTSFIVSLMQLFGINDLLKFGGNIDKLPIVEIELNKANKISSITNRSTGMGLLIDKEYKIINIFELEEQKKQSYKKIKSCK